MHEQAGGGGAGLLPLRPVLSPHQGSTSPKVDPPDAVVAGVGDLEAGSAGFIKGNSSATFTIDYTNKQTNTKGRALVDTYSMYKEGGSLDSVMHHYQVTSNAIANLSTVAGASATFSAKSTVIVRWTPSLGQGRGHIKSGPCLPQTARC